MHALLYKDFRVMWKQMKAFLLLIAIFCLIPNQALNLSAFFVVYAGLMLPMSLMSYDERAKWDTFAAMLPYASREIVLSRYLGGWLCVALAGVLYAIGGALAAGQPFPPAERLVSLGWLFALTLAAQAILFPYLFRHGVEKARLYMMIFFVVLLALVAALAGLAHKLHAKGLDVVTYTGYTLERLKALNDNGVKALLQETDLLMDGPFQFEKRDLTLPFRGSSNQRVIELRH